MSERLNAAELLGIARETLLQKILPNLGEEFRYDLLMIANAMAIARRESTHVHRAVEFEIQALAAVTGVSADSSSTALQDARLQLSQQIRDGRFDTEGHLHKDLLDTLERVVRTKLAISNPKILACEAQP